MKLSDYLRLQPKQGTALETLLSPKCKYLLYGGAMAGGKSFLLRWAALAYLIFLWEKYHIDHIPVGLFSEDYPTLKDRQISRIKREFPPEMGELKQTMDEGYAFYMDEDLGGGRIMLRNLDDPSKYMSSEFAGIFVEELTRNDQQTFEDLRNRLRYPGISEVKFMGATNPGGVGHSWVRKYFVDKQAEDPEQDRFFYVHANAYDNEFISPDYLKQLESLPEQKRKAYLEGSWDVFAGQVFSEFSRSKHVVPAFVPNKNKFNMFIGGLDWGRAAPFAFTLTGIQLKTLDGVKYYRAWTLDELYGIEKSPREWGEEILGIVNKYGLTLDDISFIQADNQIFNLGLDKGKSIHDQFADVDNRFRFKLKPADKSPNSRVAGWENLHNWLSIAPDGLPYWMMTENCRNLIRTLPALVYNETGLKIEDVSPESEDHAPDAVRYQFKAIKWVDAKLGGIGGTKDKPKMPQTAIITPEGEQISVNLDKFATAFANSKRSKIVGA